MGNSISFHLTKSSYEKDYIADFENENGYSKASEELYLNATKVVEEGINSVELLQDYSPCTEFIRLAISKPDNDEIYSKLMVHLKPNVLLTSKFYSLSTQLESIVPKLLVALQPKGAFREQPALVKRLADIFVFMITFDNLKIANPGIQNDFSYYRRCVTRKEKKEDIFIHDSQANMISLFIAEPSPMTRTVVKVAQLAYRENPLSLGVIANIANISCAIVSSKRYKDENGRWNCLRSMTGAVIVYDHISTFGAFRAKSEVKAKRCIRELRHVGSDEQAAGGKLLDCIRYSSKNFNNSPNSIKALFA